MIIITKNRDITNTIRAITLLPLSAQCEFHKNTLKTIQLC